MKREVERTIRQPGAHRPGGAGVPACEFWPRLAASPGSRGEDAPRTRSRGRLRYVCWLMVFLMVGASMFVARAQGNASFFFVDLTSSAATNAPSPIFTSLPRGALTNAGVPFRLDGPVAVTGMDAARQGDYFPSRGTGIVVGRKAARLHLLHGADHSEKDGVPMAELILHYANGEQRALRLAYGLHARSLVKERREKKSELLDPNSAVASASVGDEGDRTSSRLFRTAFDNPLPGEEIASVEWVSLFSRATPLLAALTLEQGTPTPLTPFDTSRKLVKRALESPGKTFRDELVIRALDSGDGQLLAGASAVLTIADDQSWFYFGEARVDTNGVLRLPYPPQQTTAFFALVRAPGHVPARVRGSKTTSGAFPREIAAKLERGVRVGGIVNDPNGKPVPGAKVIVYKVEKTAPREYTRTDYETVLTDTNGQWHCSSLPADFADFSFEFSHPDFRVTTLALSTDANVNTTPRDDLLAGKTVSVLQPSIRVLVVAKDEAGQPVAGAEVRVQDMQSGIILPSFKTDAKGRASFTVPEPTQVAVAVLANGFSPRLSSAMAEPLPGINSVPQNVTPRVSDTADLLDISPVPQNLGPGRLIVEPGSPLRWPVNLVAVTLTKARTFRGHVVDQYQQPVPGARVRLDSWNDSRLLQWQAVADTNGLVTWDSVPDGNLVLNVTATNHGSLNASFSGSMTEHTFNIQKFSRVQGRVFDAETKKILPDFNIVRGYAYNVGEPIRWERYNLTRGRNGEYTMRLNDYSSSGRSQIMVEAPGYMPQASPPFTKAGIFTNDFELKKSRGLSGVVETADGLPAPGATVALVDLSEYAYMDRPGELRRVNNYGDYVRTDAKGHFEFQPRLDPHTVLASSPKGFAELRVTNFLATGKIVLQPWGRIKGMVRVGKKLEPNSNVRLQNPDFQYGEEGRTAAPLWLYLKADPDEDGGFVFDRVPPGERKVYLEYKLNDKSNGRVGMSHGKLVTVSPGETLDLTLGGSGRQVIGRIALSAGDVKDVDWRRDIHMLTAVTPNGANFPVISYGNAPTEEERQKKMAEYNRRMAEYWHTLEGRAIKLAQRSYVLLFETNGTFRVESVEPGTYYLSMNVTNPERGDNSYETIGSMSQQVIVPPAPAGRPDEPFDLGTLKMDIRLPQRGNSLLMLGR